MTEDLFTHEPGPRTSGSGAKSSEPDGHAQGRDDISGSAAQSGLMGGVGLEGFSLPRAVGNSFLSTPVCLDALGETWAGYITEGIDRGRMVLVTIVPGSPRSRAVEEILAAAKTALSVRHPEVLAFLAVEDHQDSISLTSEYLDGEPLTTLLAASTQKATPFQQGVALRIIYDTIRAVSALRSVGEEVLVGGLCPEIIYLPSYGELLLRHPRLSGVAMRQLNFRRHPAALPYRAPEQLRNPRSIDETADVFSLGVLLWEMLAMRPLFGDRDHFFFGQCRTFDAQSPQDVERKIRAMPIPDLMTIQRPGAALHPDVVALTNRCLLRDPTKRFPNVGALQQAIAALPPGVVSDTRAVASTVERLGGELIRKRQQQMAQLAPMPLRSSAPPSGATSHFPDESAQTTLSLPRRIDDQRLKALMHQANLPDELPSSTDDPWCIENASGTEPPTRPQGPGHGPPPKSRPAAAPEPTGIAGHTKGTTAYLPPPRPASAPPSSRRTTATAPPRRVPPTPPGARGPDVAGPDIVGPITPPQVPGAPQPAPQIRDERGGFSAGPPPALEVPPLPDRPGSWRAALAVAVLLCSCAVGLWWTLGRGWSEAPRDPDGHRIPGRDRPARTSATADTEVETEAESDPAPEDETAGAAAPDPLTADAPATPVPEDQLKTDDLAAPPASTPTPAPNRPISRKSPQRFPRAPASKVTPSPGAADKKSDGAFRPQGI